MLEAKIREIAERVAAAEGLEILEAELRGGKSGLLRIVIDKPEGVTHQDCEKVSRQVSAILDLEDPIPHRYTLEVSSPGAERKLAKPADYVRYIGKLAKVVLRDPMPDGQGSLRGRIAACNDGRVTLEVEGKGGVVKAIDVELENVTRAQLVLEW